MKYCLFLMMLAAGLMTGTPAFGDSLALKVISCPHDFSYVSGLAPGDTCSTGYCLGMSGSRTWKSTCHFGPITIDASAVIDSALLSQANSSANADTTDPVVIVSGISHKNQSCLKDTSSWNSAFAARTTAADTMTPAEWTGKGTAFTYFRTFSVKSIVQELVNRSDWSSGDSLAFVFVADSLNSAMEQRTLAPIDNAGRGDSLLVWYHVSSGGGSGTGQRVLIRK